eukprot:Partr_v1_DN25379_c0_g1_i3_m21809 putative SWI SNF related, matrix associated, actin dependent regulator of chromatin, subfamily c, member
MHSLTADTLGSSTRLQRDPLQLDDQPRLPSRLVGRSILLTVDNSLHSEYSIAWTIEHLLSGESENHGNELILSTYSTAGNDQAEASFALLKKFVKYIGALGNGNKSRGLSVKGIIMNGVCDGDDMRKILKNIDSFRCSVLVIGCESFGKRREACSQLIALSTVPVVIVGSRPPPSREVLRHVEMNVVEMQGQTATKTLTNHDFDETNPLDQAKDDDKDNSNNNNKYDDSTLPRDKATVEEMNACPEWFPDLNKNKRRLANSKYRKKQHKTPERYLRIRNYLLDEWRQNTSKYLSKTRARRGLLQKEGDVNAIGRVFDFLHTNGHINVGLKG